jgi:subtilisin-like proprotein convertase family protein
VIAYSDHRVVSLHHCANCANRGTDTADIIANLGANVPPCSIDVLLGSVALDRGSYGCSDSISISVHDDSIQGAGSQAVTVWSDTESSSETVTLVEGDLGTFTGLVPTSTTSPLVENAVLSVAHGDTVTVQYIDADDGSGGVDEPRIATAVVDCLPPVISNVMASFPTGNGATISWNTDELADSAVVLAGGAVTMSDSDLVGLHSIDVHGAPECSTSYFSVASTDEAGNTATDDGSGEPYSFTTGPNVGLSLADNTQRPIPILSPQGVTSGLGVLDHEPVVDVDVAVEIDHDSTGELSLYLGLPSGGQVLLAKKRGNFGNDFIGTVFDDEAPTHIGAASPPFTGRFRPEQPLATADGLDAAGTWSLRAVNDAGTTPGTLGSWRLDLAYPDEPCPPSGAVPQPIPDGTDATEPLTLERTGTDSILVRWDDGCAPTQTNLLYGPLDQVSSYTVTGSVCGVTDDFAWDGVPAGNLWILLVGDDGGSIEGSWGHATGGERNGNAASGECGNVIKDASGACP